MHGGKPECIVMRNRTHTCWGTYIAGKKHVGESTYIVAWPASRGHHACGLPPCTGLVPHRAFGFPTMYLNQRYLNQALRKEMKTSELTHARAVRKAPTNSWEQGPRKRMMREASLLHGVGHTLQSHPFNLCTCK